MISAIHQHELATGYICPFPLAPPSHFLPTPPL